MEEELLEAWKAWDENPTWYDTPIRLERAVHAVAEHHGLNTLQFRRLMAEKRREGWEKVDEDTFQQTASHEDCLKEIFDDPLLFST